MHPSLCFVSEVPTSVSYGQIKDAVIGAMVIGAAVGFSIAWALHDLGYLWPSN